MVAELRPVLAAPDHDLDFLLTCGRRCIRTRIVDVPTGRLVWAVRHSALDHQSVCSACLNESQTIKTGPLVVDVRRARVTVAGADVPLSTLQLHLLLCLAARLDAVVGWPEILHEVWGERGADVTDHRTMAHVAQVTLARLRAALGPARHLIVTRPNIGLRLVAAPVEAQP